MKIKQAFQLLVPLKYRAPIIHWRATGVWPDLSEPKTMSEKLCWRKANLWKIKKASDLLSLTGDKASMRCFVESIGLASYLNPCFRSYASWEAIDFDLLPSQFVLKVSNASTMNHVVKNKSSEDLEALEKKVRKWMLVRWGKVAGEWWYSNATPRLVVEGLLSGKADSLPDDYKFYVGNGRVMFVQQDSGKGGGGYCRRLYDRSQNLIPATFNEKKTSDIPLKTDAFEIMLQLAEDIGRYFDFARVDFYDTNQGVFIGEITHAPASGWMRFSDPELDRKFGNMMPVYGPRYQWRPQIDYFASRM